MPKRAPRNLLDYLIARAGIRRGMRIATFIAQWTMAQQALGHEPSVDEAAAWWKESRATWYRRLDEFRGIFGATSTPGRFAAAAIAEADERIDAVGEALAALGRVPPVAVAA